jgi:ankyrin repeat protein
MKTKLISAVFAIIFSFISPAAGAQDSRDDLLQQFFADRRTEIEKIADDPGRMKEFVLSQSDVNTRYKDGQTLLHYAAIKGYPEIAALLLKKKADINLRDNDGRTPLHEAMRYRAFGVARFLVENGADVNIKNKDGEAPIISVVYLDDKKLAVDLVNFFIQKGFDVKKSADARLLNETIRRQHRDVALILLQNNIKFDDSALMDSARIGYEDVFTILISKGANPKQKGIIGAACESGNLNIVKILVESGQEPTAEEIDSALFKGHVDLAVYLNALLKKTKGQQVDIKKRCYLKPDPGTCKALFFAAYYNLATKTCAEFIYGGCGGEVPFDTIEACKKVCE